MRIDAYTHFFPAKYFDNLVASKVPDIGKRVREVPAIHDLDIRRKVIDSFPDYRQIICVALPPIGTYTPPERAEATGITRNATGESTDETSPDLSGDWLVFERAAHRSAPSRHRNPHPTKSSVVSRQSSVDGEDDHNA